MMIAPLILQYPQHQPLQLQLLQLLQRETLLLLLQKSSWLLAVAPMLNILYKE